MLKKTPNNGFTSILDKAGVKNKGLSTENKGLRLELALLL